MFEKNNKLGFQKGRSGNESGGEPKRVRRSQLRKTIDKLREVEDLALENVKASVEGQEINKDCLQSSKWVLEKIADFCIKASTEEEKNNNMKLKNQEALKAEEEQGEVEESTPRPAVFQLTVAK